MKKYFFSLVAAIVAATATYAQNSLVATLNHDNTISVFNGMDAFKEAMEAAEDGDMITLSSGTFNSTNITKAVKLRGTGIREGNTTESYVTRIIGEFSINIPTSEYTLSMEGIKFHDRIYTGVSDNASINKCYFTTLNIGTNGWTLTNCNIEWIVSLDKSTASATFINCRVRNPQISYGAAEFVNCVIKADYTSGLGDVKNSSFTNCIIVNDNKNIKNALPETNMAYHCIGYDASGEAPVFSKINKNANTELTEDEYNALFKEGTFFELTDEAKALYKGNDDTEVGIYGGVLPYDTNISNPRITKCKVAQKTTTDGKLSVDIEVKAAE